MGSQKEKESSGQIKITLIAGLFALITAIVSGVFLIINTLVEKGSILVMPTLTPEITSSATYSPTIAQTITSNVASTNSPSVLFSEDFEDGRVQNLTYISGDWEIIDDGTGNNVYEIDNTKVSTFYSMLVFDSPSSSTWKNYEVQCRVKMLNLTGNATPEFLVSFNHDSSESGYVLNLQPSSEVVDLVPVSRGQWQEGISRHYKYSPNTWYSIRIVAKDSTIQVYINNALIIDTNLYETKTGNVEINIGPKSQIQLDDIKIIKIGE